MAESSLTAARLRELLHYDPETGVFTRLTRPAKRVAVGDIAGSLLNTGYSMIGVDSRQYLAHRLAWLHVYGKWPSGVIDHIDGVRLNNRIANLRDVSELVNSQNIRQARPKNKTGFLGVSWCNITKKYKAQIRSQGAKTHLGVFATAEQAHAAYLAAKRERHQGCTL